MRPQGVGVQGRIKKYRWPTQTASIDTMLQSESKRTVTGGIRLRHHPATGTDLPTDKRSGRRGELQQQSQGGEQARRTVRHDTRSCSPAMPAFGDWHVGRMPRVIHHAGQIVGHAMHPSPFGQVRQRWVPSEPPWQAFSPSPLDSSPPYRFHAMRARAMMPPIANRC